MTTLRILVAEDNEDHLFFITRALREIEDRVLDVDTVRDGVEAMAYLRREGDYAGVSRPHLIILDLKMPRVGGLEVIARVRRDPDLRTIPIAVLSSSDREDDIDQAYGLGGNTYVVKEAAGGGLTASLACLRDFWTDVAVLPDPVA